MSTIKKEQITQINMNEELYFNHNIGFSDLKHNFLFFMLLFIVLFSFYILG